MFESCRYLDVMEGDWKYMTLLSDSILLLLPIFAIKLSISTHPVVGVQFVDVKLSDTQHLIHEPFSFKAVFGTDGRLAFDFTAKPGGSANLEISRITR